MRVPLLRPARFRFHALGFAARLLIPMAIRPALPLISAARGGLRRLLGSIGLGGVPVGGLLGLIGLGGL